MVAGKQNIGDALAAKFGRTRVMRIFEQAAGVRVILRAGRVAERAGQETRNRVDEDQCGEFTSGQNVIADGDFVGDEMLADALIHALVAAADQGEAFVRGQRAGDGLRENTSLRRKQNDGRSAQWSKNGFDRLEERDRLPNHPAATSVRKVTRVV